MQKSFKELVYVEIGRDIGSGKNIFLMLVKSHCQVIKAIYYLFKMSANLTSISFQKKYLYQKTAKCLILIKIQITIICAFTAK